jgi:hypothetical protein
MPTANETVVDILMQNLLNAARNLRPTERALDRKKIQLLLGVITLQDELYEYNLPNLAVFANYLVDVGFSKTDATVIMQAMLEFGITLADLQTKSEVGLFKVFKQSGSVGENRIKKIIKSRKELFKLLENRRDVL